MVYENGKVLRKPPYFTYSHVNFDILIFGRLPIPNSIFIKKFLSLLLSSRNTNLTAILMSLLINIFLWQSRERRPRKMERISEQEAHAVARNDFYTFVTFAIFVEIGLCYVKNNFIITYFRFQPSYPRTIWDSNRCWFKVSCGIHSEVSLR